MDKNHQNGPPEKRKPNHIPIYYSGEFCDLVRFIKQEINNDVYLTGLRAMLEHGMPAHRLTEDFEIYALITPADRDKMTNYVRHKYPKSKTIWKKWGFSLDFYPIERVHHVDINTEGSPLIDESWRAVQITLGNTSVYLPPFADLIALKINAGRPKDLRDVAHAFRTSLHLIPLEQLKQKSRKLGVLKQLIKFAKKHGVDIRE